MDSQTYKQPLNRKTAALLEGTSLQPHQQGLADEASRSPLRKLLYYSLGSGKTLAGIAAAEAHGAPYTAVVPAALRPNFRTEQKKFTDGSLPADVMSYSELALGKKPVPHPRSLIFDEFHRARSPGTSAAAARAHALARDADQVLLLTGTPLINGPGDLASPLSALTKKDVSPEEFESRYLRTRKVRPGLWRRLFDPQAASLEGEELEPDNMDELRSLLEGHVDYYAPAAPPVSSSREDVHVAMGPEQSQLYRGMWQRLPRLTRWKLQNDFPLAAGDLMKLRSFLTGPRQVSLSTLPFLRNKDPRRAFLQSPKLQAAAKDLLETLGKDDRSKALVFSNFIDAGLVPYADELKRRKVPHAVFHGGLGDAERQALVDDYNQGRLRAALIGPAGMEGLSFKGTQLVQQLDPHFQGTRPRQAEGRAVRFDSHTGLPEELRNVRVRRYISRLPPGLAQRMRARLFSLGRRGAEPSPASDDYLMRLSEKKDRLNRPFLDLLKEVGSAGKEKKETVSEETVA